LTEAAEGFGYARDYLQGLEQLARQQLTTPDEVHRAIQRGDSLAPPSVATVPGTLASAAMGLVSGASVATASAMRTVQRYTRTFMRAPDFRVLRDPLFGGSHQPVNGTHQEMPRSPDSDHAGGEDKAADT
jgi:hypothetical protein